MFLFKYRFDFLLFFLFFIFEDARWFVAFIRSEFFVKEYDVDIILFLLFAQFLPFGFGLSVFFCLLLCECDLNKDREAHFEIKC